MNRTAVGGKEKAKPLHVLYSSTEMEWRLLILEWNGNRLTDLQVRDWFQNEDPSSKLNSTPPMGAPNAAVQRGQRRKT